MPKLKTYRINHDNWRIVIELTFNNFKLDKDSEWDSVIKAISMEKALAQYAAQYIFKSNITKEINSRILKQ